MVEFNMDQPATNELPFLVERARAIELYAQVEQSLCHLFSDLLGAPWDFGGIVFFRITNTSARNAILDALLTKRFGTTYEHHWNGIPNTPNKKGLFTLLRQIDSRRNEIVHWHSVTNVHVEAGAAISTLALMRPNAWSFPADITYIGVAQMQEFSALASFVARSVNMFTAYAAGRLAHSGAEQAWRDICQRPCTYPPPEGHPLTQKPSTP